MTVSAGERAAAMKRVLVRLSEMFWDEPRGTFGDADLVGTSPMTTTLAELEDKGFIELVAFVSNPQPYVLTSDGWFHAQRIAGRFDTEEFDARRGRLCAALKGTVKGRQDEALLDYQEVAQRANLPEGWVWNMLEGQTLHVLDPRGRYRLRFEDDLIYVPPTFGQVEVSLD
jgi:hypothetical protein